MAIHVLEEAAAGEHVDRLEAAADPEDRQPTSLRHGPRFGLERIARRFDGGRTALGPAVSRGMEVGAPAEQQAVHRRQRIGQPLGRGGGIDHDRAGALTAHRGLVQGPLARGEGRIARSARRGNGHDDARWPGSGRWHRHTIASAGQSPVGADGPPASSERVGSGVALPGGRFSGSTTLPGISRSVQPTPRKFGL